MDLKYIVKNVVTSNNNSKINFISIKICNRSLVKKCVSLILCATILFVCPLYAQTDNSNKLSQSRIIGLILNRQVSIILNELDSIKVPTDEEKNLKVAIEKRFKFKTDKSKNLNLGDNHLNELYQIYKGYWRKSLLDSNRNYDKSLSSDLCTFLKKEKLIPKSDNSYIDSLKLDSLIIHYIQNKGYHSLGYSKVQSLYDLIIWKTQKDSIYNVALVADTLDVKVCFMDTFLTLGWLGYASFESLGPGGWATKDGIFCVQNKYKDLTSEDFLFHYLKHETQHYSDKNKFPKLLETDLEYRAKLIELIYAKTSLLKTINEYIGEARQDQTTAHAFAAFCIIRDLSKELFGTDFENSSVKWDLIPKIQINNAAEKLYLRNTMMLNSIGKEVNDILN